jgi:hypothetical protein
VTPRPDQLVDVQDEYRAIKDSFQRVRLPNDFKIDDTKQGIKRTEQSKCTIINRCAGFTETLMKILLTVRPGSTFTEDLWSDLFTVAEAQIRYLQEERALVLVNSSLGDNVATLYRSFRRNTSAFPSDALDALNAAVSLSAANQSTSQPSQRPYLGRGVRSRSFTPSFRGSRFPSSSTRVPSTRFSQPTTSMPDENQQ